MALAAAAEELVFNVEEQPLEMGMARTSSNAPTEYWTTYMRFIDTLRRRYPPIGPHSATLTFDIVLRSNSHQIKLRLNRPTFYLIGYRMETPQQWVKSGVETKAGSSWRCSSDHDIAQFPLLDMQFEYEDLERECGQKIESIALGQQQLSSAVDLLAISTCRRDRARSLIVVSLMICEGIRFSHFSDYLAAMFHDNLPSPQWMIRTLETDIVTDGVTELDQCIGSGDQALDRVDCDLSSGEDSPDFESGDVEIPTANLIGQAAETTNTDLVACDKEDYNCHHPGEGNSVPFKGKPFDISTDDDGTSDVCTDEDETFDMDHPRLLQPVIGKRLLPGGIAEVFFVRVSSTKGMHPCSLYGTIRVTDYGLPQNIYDRGPEQSEFVQPGDLILLTGPVKPIDIYDLNVFSLALMGESIQEFSSFSWHGKYDVPIYDDSVGEQCSLMMCYIALPSAEYGTVTVIFIDKDRNDHARVYGQLSACCGKFGYEIVLFQAKAEEYIDVCPGRAITLLRNLVSVPWDSRLVLRVDLFAYSDTCFDQEIAKCVMEFPLECIAGSSTLFERIMYRESGKIRVKVAWNYDPWD